VIDQFITRFAFIMMRDTGADDDDDDDDDMCTASRQID
jgi:hypothetical protein